MVSRSYNHVGFTEFTEILKKKDHYLAINPAREFYIHGLDSLDEDSKLGHYPWGYVTEILQGDLIDGHRYFRANFPKEQITFIWPVCFANVDFYNDVMRIKVFPNRIKQILKELPQKPANSFKQIIRATLMATNNKIDEHIKECQTIKAKLNVVIVNLETEPLP